MKWCNFFNKISLILQALGCAVLYFVIEAIYEKCRHYRLGQHKKHERL